MDPLTRPSSGPVFPKYIKVKDSFEVIISIHSTDNLKSINNKRYILHAWLDEEYRSPSYLIVVNKIYSILLIS